VDNGFGKYNSILEVPGKSHLFPMLFTEKTADKKIMLTVQNDVTDVFVYWQNYRLPDKFVKVVNGQITLDIPAEATALERSFIRVWAANAEGVSNDVLIPLHKGDVLTQSKQLTRTDKHAQIMYFMLVDRFMNGDTLNDKPLNRPDVDPRVDFWGGDLAGLQQKIEDGYFEKLGVNLWVSPLNQNPKNAFREYPEPHRKYSGYHGYWPVSSTKVDYRYGTDYELKKMVASAHSQDINVILDYVAHHVHSEHFLAKQHPEWFTQLDLPDGRKNIRLWDECRLTTWFDTFLPTFDFSKPEVVECMSDSALGWITNFDLDGFRHDATKHIPESFQRRLTQKIKNQIIIPQNKSFYQIGNIWKPRTGWQLCQFRRTRRAVRL